MDGGVKARGGLMPNYRFSWLRPGGWTRLGVVGAVGVLFATPMLWSIGVFGDGEDTLKRALIFLFSGMWFFIGVGYVSGWSIRGFMLRVKDPDTDAEDQPARRPAVPAHPPAGPAHRPGH